MKTTLSNHKSYVIETEEGIENGIFFRSPIQKVDFDAYYGNMRFSAYKYMKQIQNPIRKLYEILIGNGNIVRNINKWNESMDFGGFIGNILCIPIYFERKYRKLKAISTNNTDNIQEIRSYGFESEFNECGGACKIEKTVVTLNNGKKLKLTSKDYYHYTYAHIIEKVIDTGVLK